jgi:FADH2 O2-dependent halogenase
LLLEELATRYDLPTLTPLSKWGTWRSTHPELACGLKRGFSFFHHDSHQNPILSRDQQLLVAASPRDAIADTHWFRADFDAFLVQETQRLGVAYLDEVELQHFTVNGNHAHLSGLHHGNELRVATRFVVDATGPRGFLHRTLQLGERQLPGLPATQAIYSHFAGIQPLQETGHINLEGIPPYPIDDAAIHHLFKNGWIWMLHFSNGLTSAGLVATPALANQIQIADPPAAWSRMLQRAPALHAQFQGAKPVQPFRHLPRLAFRSAASAGANWALLPSAAGFVDPLLSTGFPLTLLGISRLAEILQHDWGTPKFETQLRDYAEKTDAELLATARLIAALYTNLGNFPLFTALTLLYFASASYSETARRLGRPQLAPSFLLHDHPVFGPASARVLQLAASAPTGANADALIHQILRAIDPIDVAGLTTPDRRNWYPVEAEDLLQAAHKLDATSDEIHAMLARCGFNSATSSPSSAQSGSAS